MGVPHAGRGASVNNFFDRAVAALALALLSPALFLAGLLIKLSSPGPILYRAQRVGIGGRRFTMFKLRTMRVGSASTGAITAVRDPRVFPVGFVLRRTKLDELPQLINVLRGDMALVGPRPEDVDIVEAHYDDLMRESLLVRPGITSPGSLHYFADEDDLPREPAEAQRVYLDSLLRRKIALDLAYVRNRSFAYEMMLLLRTVLGILGLSGLFRKQAERELALAAEIVKEWHSQ